jgi:transposase-like protein
LQIPKIRQGGYFPSFLEPRRRSEQALLAVVQQAYVCRVSTRRVDQLVESLGLRISKSEVSRVAARWMSTSTRSGPGRWRAATRTCSWVPRSRRVRAGGRVVNKALVIAHGVHETGRREIPSLDVGEAETEAFWTSFLRGLVKRGLVGVQLAISDAHSGLKAAIAKVLGCAWQRCAVHFLRDCLGHARRDQHGLLAALIRPIFTADSLAQGARSALGGRCAPRRPAGQGRVVARGRGGRVLRTHPARRHETDVRARPAHDRPRARLRPRVDQRIRRAAQAHA